MNGNCKGAIFGGSRTLGPWGGIIKFQLQSQFQIYLNQTFVCVFSQMKDIKHIRRDLHSVAWVMPWVLGGQKSKFLNIVMLHIKLKKDDQ